jgi:hypothetical protein
MDRTGQASPEVLHPGGQPLFAVRPAAGVLPTIRAVPDVFPRTGLAWNDSWRHESELVMSVKPVKPVWPVEPVAYANGLTGQRGN